MKFNIPKLGGQLGTGCIVAGFVLVFLGWNGAASEDRVPSQFPYLISGGVAGLCLVVVGIGVLMMQAQRADRAELKASLDALRDAIERNGAGGAGSTLGVLPTGAVLPEGAVVAGADSFHRPECHLVEGRSGLPVFPGVDEALDAGLTPCRVCDPVARPVVPASVQAEEPSAPAPNRGTRPAPGPGVRRRQIRPRDD